MPACSPSSLLLALPGVASAAQLIDRNATGVQIRVEREGRGDADLPQGQRGEARPRLGRDQRDRADGGRAPAEVQARLLGRLGHVPHGLLEDFPGSCGRYDGPALPNIVAACKAPDGSYWAAQSWPQPLPNLGFTPWSPELRANWLEVSHWTVRSRSSRPARTGCTAGASRRSSAATRISARRSTASARRASARRPTASAASSISTRTTRCTVGLATRELVRHSQPDRRLLLRLLLVRSDEGRLQASARLDGEARPRRGEKYRLLASGPGVTPNVATIVDGLHAFDPANPADVAWQTQQSSILLSWGDKSCRAGLS